MGSNGFFNPIFRSVNRTKGTNIDTGYRIHGHKVLVGNEPTVRKFPVESHSRSPIYLIGRVDKKTKVIRIEGMGFYHNHRIVRSVDFEFDELGNVIPYAREGKSSHSHLWPGDSKTGLHGRVSHVESNRHPTDVDTRLVDKIVKFNKEKHIWDK